MLMPVPALRRALSVPLGTGVRVLLSGQFRRRTPADVLLDHAAVNAAAAVIVAAVASAAIFPGHRIWATLCYVLSFPRITVESKIDLPMI